MIPPILKKRKIRKLYFLAFSYLFFIPIIGSAQISDSLYNILPDTLKPATRTRVTNDEKRKMLRLARFYISPSMCATDMNGYIADLEKENTHANLKTQMNNWYAISCYTIRKIDLIDKTENLYDSILYYGNDKPEYDQIVTTALANKGELYVSKGAYVKAADMYNRSLRIFYRLRDSVNIGNTYGKMSDLYSALKMGAEANSLSDSAYAYLITTVSQPDFFFQDYAFNKVMLYVNWAGNDSAHADLYIKQANYFLDTATSLIRGKQPELYSYAYFLKGLICYVQQHYDQAIVYIDSSLQPELLQKDLYPELIYYKNIYKGLALSNLGKIQEGIALVESNISDTKYPELDQVDLYKELYSLYKQRGDFQSALKYYELYQAGYAQLNIQKYQLRLQEISQKYALVEKENQLKTAENTALINEQARNKAILGIIVLLLLLIISALLFYNNLRKQQMKRMEAEKAIERERQKREQELFLREVNLQIQKTEALLSQRKRISENMHDDLSSPLVSLKYQIVHLKASAQSEETKNTLKLLEEEAEHIYSKARQYIHQLYKGGERIDYNIMDFLYELSDMMAEKKLALQVNMDVDEEALVKQLSLQQHEQLIRIVKEVVSNVIKHAQATMINIQIKVEGKNCHFRIEDDGIGFDPDKLRMDDGMGIANLYARIKDLKGTISIQSGSKGSCIEGFFPLSTKKSLV